MWLMTKFLVIKKTCDRDGYVVGRVEKCHHDPLMAYFQITSEIYRIANNLICQASNVVLISHLKQFIGCSLTIIHEGHACFMNNQSNSKTSRLDNEELLRGMRPIQAQRRKRDKYLSLQITLNITWSLMWMCVCLSVLTNTERPIFVWLFVWECVSIS